MLSLTELRPQRRIDRSRSGLWGVALIVGACAVALAACALVVDRWYAGAHLRTWTPPEWVFGSAWTALFAALAGAASIVWLARHRGDVCCPLTAFTLLLVLNVVWCVCFFGLRSPLLGFLDACLLWVVSAVTTAEFFMVSSVAGWLMVPYWLWVTCATTFNGAVLILGSGQ
jgi:tryptophan-rich sensory protein